MAAWKLTIRNGSDVTRTKHDDLDEAIEAGRKVIEEVISEPPLRRVKSLRDFEPEQQIKARVEIAGKGIFRQPTAGVDVHGDNSMLAFQGGVVRKPLPGSTEKEVFESIRQSLT